jgi:hypothetical protein
MSKLLFANSIGLVYDDKVVIDNNRFLFKRIMSIDVEEKVDNKTNLSFFIFSILFFMIAQLQVSNILFYYVFLILCSILLLFSVVYNSKEYYLIFSISIGNQTELRVKSKNEKEAKKFLNLAMQAKEKSVINESSKFEVSSNKDEVYNFYNCVD